MPNPPDKETVISWIDNELVASTRSCEDPNAEYNIQLTQSGWNLSIIRSNGSDVIRIIGRINLDPETLALILDNDRMVRDLRTQLAAVLTGSSSLYSYRDGDDQPCSFEDMRTIQFEERIYPDGASQDRVMNGLMGIVKAMTYLQSTIGAYREDLDSNR